MKQIFILVFLGWITLVSMSLESFYTERYWTVTSNSLIKITGSTNVNNFSCISISYSGQDIMTERFHVESKIGVLNGKVVMKANGFDCDNYMMTRDFKKTLSAKEYPEIEVKFNGIPNIHAINESQDKISAEGEVEITLAGETRTYMLAYMIKEETDGSKFLLGNRSFLFSDFGLETPKKFFGMVTVNDEVSVDFILKLEYLDNK